MNYLLLNLVHISTIIFSRSQPVSQKNNRAESNIMGILEDLWDGKIVPCERKSTPTEEAVRKVILKKEEKLTPLLSPEAKEIFEELMDSQGELASLNDCEIFAEGFRMGAKLMLETLK